MRTPSPRGGQLAHNIGETVGGSSRLRGVRILLGRGFILGEKAGSCTLILWQVGSSQGPHRNLSLRSRFSRGEPSCKLGSGFWWWPCYCLAWILDRPPSVSKPQSPHSYNGKAEPRQHFPKRGACCPGVSRGGATWTASFHSTRIAYSSHLREGKRHKSTPNSEWI